MPALSRLEEWSIADNRSDLARAQEPQQVWQVFCNLLDEYVQILGQQQPFLIDEFADLLMAGLRPRNTRRFHQPWIRS